MSDEKKQAPADAPKPLKIDPALHDRVKANFSKERTSPVPPKVIQAVPPKREKGS